MDGRRSRSSQAAAPAPSRALPPPPPPLPPRPRGRPKRGDAGEIEARLIATALAAFVAHGYGATSMASIARAARVSKNTLYARFPSKADLFRAIILGRLAAAPGERQAAGGRGRTLRATLCAYLEHMLRASLGGELLQINRLIYSEAARFPELGRAAAERTALGVEQVAALLLEAAAKDGRACDDARAAAALFLLPTRGWYSDILLADRHPGGPEIRATVERLVDHFLAARA